MKNYYENFKQLDKKYNLLFLIIILLAFGVRLYYFSITSDQPVWWDEGDYMSYAKSIGKNLEVNDIWYYRRTFFLPLLWGGMFKLGLSEAALRFTEVLFSIGLVIISYFAAKEMFNKKVGLICAFGLAFSRLVLFAGTRFLTEIPALFFFLTGLWMFWKGYVKEKNNKLILLSGVFIGLAIFTRFAMFLSLIPLGLYYLINEKGKFWKNKYVIMMFLIVLLILTPFFVKYYQNYGGIINFIQHYTEIGVAETTEKTVFMGVNGIWGYMNSISVNVGKIFSLLFILGLPFFANLLGIDKIFKNKQVKKTLFILVWILVPLIFHGMYSEYVQERYLLWAYPAVLMIAGLGFVSVYNYSKKYGKTITSVVAVLLIALILFNGYTQIKMGDVLIKEKLNSYKEVKEAALWMKGNTVLGDIIISNSVPQTQYYSERSVYMARNESHLKSLNAKFMVASIFERSSEWFYKYPEDNKLKVVNAWYIDGQPTLIIYELP